MKIFVSAKPNSGTSKIEEVSNGSFIAQLKSTPTDGKANKELVRLLSKYFHVPQASIHIARGENGKKKIIEIREK